MEIRRRCWGLAAAAGMLVFILDSKTALSGANEGVQLCIRTVIPSLFPFFVLSALMTGALMGTSLRGLRPLCRLMKMPVGAESFKEALRMGAEIFHSLKKVLHFFLTYIII